MILTLTATELTPAHLPDEIEVAAYACIDKATCQRVTIARHVHQEAASRLH